MLQYVTVQCWHGQMQLPSNSCKPGSTSHKQKTKLMYFADQIFMERSLPRTAEGFNPQEEMNFPGLRLYT